MITDGCGARHWVESSVLRITLLILLLWLLIPVAACRYQHGGSAIPSAGGQAQHTGTTADSRSAELATGPIKQLIIIYTGDTLSIPEANDDYKPPEGGLSGLYNAITAYEGQILRFNQLRVENEGGDASQVRADFDAGMLGDNPFMLLDYGYWERPNDVAGELLVKLYLEMYTKLRFTAVASTLNNQLQPQQWRAYKSVAPTSFHLLLSAGAPALDAIASDPIVTRELYGAKWGVVSIPVPAVASVPPQEIEQVALKEMQGYVEAAAAKLKQARCQYSVLLATGGPASLYQALQQDKRFTVVLGAPVRNSAKTGYGACPASGPLMLPALEGGGRELAACHLIYPPAGSRPSQYNLVRLRCTDDGKQPYPYRKQVKAAVAKHRELTAKPNPPAAH
jgi:hypothetical protein